MKTITVGDRVRLVKLGPFDGSFMRLHDTGTVVKADSFGIQVRWDNPERKDNGGKWWVNRDHCEVIEQPVGSTSDELSNRVDEYIEYWNKGWPSPGKTVEVLKDCRAEIERLRNENARLNRLVHKLVDEPND